MFEIALSREISLRDYYQRLEEAYERGYKKGLIIVAKMDIAKKLFQNGVEINCIMKCTDLSKDEIEKLICDEPT